MEDKVPEISVLMPVYNGETFLKEAIDSILAQSFKDFELIIINDGSTDNSQNIIHSYSDERIKYFKNDRNLGVIRALNNGLYQCKGKFIARMDQDDISLPKRFERQLEYLNTHPEVSVLSSKLILIDEEGNEQGYWNDDYETTTINEIKTFMPKLNCIGHPSVIMKSEVAKQFGYNKLFKNSDDWGLWLTLLSEGYVIAKIDEVLLKYRVHQSSATVNANKINVSKKIISFKRKYLFHKLGTFNFKGTDKKVLRYLVIDMLKYYFPFVYTFMIKYIQTNFSELRSQKKIFNNFFNHFPKETDSIFFFPFYHLGGAEIVHTEIVKAVAFAKPLILFTNYSGTDTLLESFQSHANTLSIDQLLIWPSSRKKVIEKIRTICEANKKIVLFSSNSKFYYDFLKFKPKYTKAIDLIHAFMHSHEDSSEKWSLPVIDKLNHRVIINLKTGKDLEKLYKRNNIFEDYLKRIVFISNYVDLHEYKAKNFDEKIKILYVGRGTSEKRVHLLAMIAKRLKELNLNIEFNFVGDVLSAIPHELKQYCIIHGEIRDKAELNKLYSDAQVLAMASTREGFPMVIMEAMMHGTIPITSNVGGISQHVNESNGILINEIEPSAFIDSFVNEFTKLISDKNRMKKMSENAYQYAKEHFNEKQFTEGYIKLFKD